jgi:hypothetical protein
MSCSKLGPNCEILWAPNGIFICLHLRLAKSSKCWSPGIEVEDMISTSRFVSLHWCIWVSSLLIILLRIIIIGIYDYWCIEHYDDASRQNELEWWSSSSSVERYASARADNVFLTNFWQSSFVQMQFQMLIARNWWGRHDRHQQMRLVSLILLDGIIRGLPQTNNHYWQL